MQRVKWFSVVLAALVFLTACGEDTTTSTQGGSVRTGAVDSAGVTTAEDTGSQAAETPERSNPVTAQDSQVPMTSYEGGGGYIAPAFATAEYHPALAQGTDQVHLDLSALSQGYVAVSANSDKRLKFQVVCGELTYNYDLDADGTPWIYPLQCGSGEYRFRVMENVAESRYAELYAETCQVNLTDEFTPFVRPSSYVNYSQDSSCVKKAQELAAQAADAVGVVANVYSYVCQSVIYDQQKAASVQSGYLPVPDHTLQSGKGICFDYAALAAAMLRSQGIPTKMVFGYVSPNDLYHAWNMFYTRETGWVTVNFQVSGGSWNRLDLTFSASGADSTFIGDGSNYTDLYFY